MLNATSASVVDDTREGHVERKVCDTSRATTRARDAGEGEGEGEIGESLAERRGWTRSAVESLLAAYVLSYYAESPEVFRMRDKLIASTVR